MSFNMNTQHLEQQIRQKFYEILRHVISMDFDSTIFTIMNQEKLLEYLERIKRLKIDTDKLWEWIRSNDFPSLTLQQSYTMPLIQLTAKIELATLLDFEQPIIPLIIEEERNGIVTTTTTTTSMDGNSKKVVVTTKNVGKKNSSKQQQQQQEEAETSLSNSTYYSTNSEFNNADFEDESSDDSSDSSDDSDDDDENFTGVSSCSTPYFHRRIDEKSRDCEEDDEEEDDDDDDDDSSDPETLNICDLSSFNDSYQTFSTVTIDEVDNQNVANENDTFTGDNPENGDNSAITISNKEVEVEREKILQSDSGIQNIDGTQSTRAGSETEQNKILCNSSHVKNDDNGSNGGGDHISTLNIVHENLTNEQQQSNEQANCSGDANENENENEKVNKQQQQQKNDKLIQLIQLILANLMEKEKLNELIAECLINHTDHDGSLLSFQLNTINGLKPEMKCYYRQELYDYDDHHNGCFIESNNDDNNNNNVGNEHQQTTPKKFVQNNQFAKLFLRNSNPTERSVLKKRYLINLNLIAELYHIQYLPIDYLVECLNHICERNEQIQQKHLKNLDYLRLVRLFIENIRPNIDQLSNESLQQAKYYRLICKRLDKILKYQTTMMMAAAVDDHEDDNIVDYKGSISMMNNQSSSTTAKSQTFAMKISKLLDSINNNNTDQVIERRHYSF
ncbi:hypothetical protein DERP_011080 [Dermatophagoides pteronyssinus]|uniref:Uncharacterized protein n=1 Tax=Dermatophagoides pteronyssinus TaxID=6956 RepID=A0ABQ8J8T6_DERPT|nr:hypothetical protein DERP_011080 [Dermatophagoides pteronyssinus]